MMPIGAGGAFVSAEMLEKQSTMPHTSKADTIKLVISLKCTKTKVYEAPLIK